MPLAGHGLARGKCVEGHRPLCYTPHMAITRDEVRHVALLARLQLTEAEETAITEQLDNILSHFETLQQLDTAGVEPTSHVVAMATPFREDAVRNVPDAEALLANAPGRDGRFFKVPKIIE